MVMVSLYLYESINKRVFERRKTCEESARVLSDHPSRIAKTLEIKPVNGRLQRLFS
jgi:uncharacterized protein (DUF2384 family)